MANVRKGLAGQLLAGPGSLAIAGVAVNGGNLLANLFLARALNESDYGAVVVQINIFLILSMAGSALQVAVVQRETSVTADTRRERSWWIRRLRGLAAVTVAVSCGLAVAVSDPLASVIHYHHAVALAEVVVAAAVWASLSIERGLLQARAAYDALAKNLVIEALARIGFMVGLALAGLGVAGAGVGVLAGVLLATEHARRESGKAPGAVSRPAARPARALPVDATGPLLIIRGTPTRTRHAITHDTMTALGALVPLALLQNMDVVIVGRLNAAHVGSYAAISTACKVPVFIGLAVANFLLPEAARLHRQGERATKALMSAVGWVVAPGLLLVVIGLLDAKALLKLVFGPRLTGASGELWVLALAMTCLAITLLFTNYLLGAGVRRIVAVLIVGTVLTVGGLIAANGGLWRTVVIGLVCQALTAAGAGLMMLRATAAGVKVGSQAEPSTPWSDVPEPEPAGSRAARRPAQPAGPDQPARLAPPPRLAPPARPSWSPTPPPPAPAARPGSSVPGRPAPRPGPPRGLSSPLAPDAAGAGSTPAGPRPDDRPDDTAPIALPRPPGPGSPPGGDQPGGDQPGRPHGRLTGFRGRSVPG